jgi:hypothetical protein
VCVCVCVCVCVWVGGARLLHVCFGGLCGLRQPLPSAPPGGVLRVFKFCVSYVFRVFVSAFWLHRKVVSVRENVRVRFKALSWILLWIAVPMPQMPKFGKMTKGPTEKVSKDDMHSPGFEPGSVLQTVQGEPCNGDSLRAVRSAHARALVYLTGNQRPQQVQTQLMPL